MIIPFKIEHFDAMDIKETCHVSRETRSNFEKYGTMGPAYTLMTGGPVACGGVAVLRRGLGEIWMVASKGIAGHPVSVCRVGRHVLKAADALGLHRVQASVECDDVIGINYIESFGFACEGVMWKYGPNGEDFLLYSRVT